MAILYKELTKELIATFYDVYNDLGYGFLERVYQNALYKELCRRGFTCEVQKPIKVYHKGEVVGDYIADIIVDNKIILELKAVNELVEQHECQLINYLKATNIEVGFLFNFGPEPSFIRKVFTVDRKRYNMEMMEEFIDDRISELDREND